MTYLPNIPVFWHITEPIHAGRLEADVRVKPARHGAVDDGLLLFVEKFDESLFVSDETVDAEVIYINESNDDRLLFRRWLWDKFTFQ